MNIISFQIQLTSDAEPGTGLGGDVINQLVPRDHHGRPVLRASHIKGLMRQQLRDMIKDLGWDESLETWVFGREGPGDDLGAASIFQVVDAIVEPNGTPAELTGLVTRTQVDDQTGVASDATLRTTERVAAGTVFRGAIHTDLPAGSVADLAWRLALLSIPAVGGSRNRGCGVCVVSIDGETRLPGELLALLDGALAGQDWQEPLAQRLPRGPLLRTERDSSGDAVTLRLVFQALTPICCPEHPCKANVISTGFSIPTSAVQGAILYRLNEVSPSLATETFNDAAFRAWPLHPCRLPEFDSAGQDLATDGQRVSQLREELAKIADQLPVPIRVSLTHRVAKYSVGGRQSDELQARHFFDEAIDELPEDWTKVADGAPLKAMDGVLLVDGDQVRLWRASSLPHVLTSHGVHGASRDERNLFTTDALAPLIWDGIAVLPRRAAEQLLRSLRANPCLALGKSRSVRGLGILHAIEVSETPTAWRLSARTPQPVLVVQSPLQLADSPDPAATAEDELRLLAEAWAERHGLPVPRAVWSNPGLRFGWNRHDRGPQQACRVVLPGSVIAFDSGVDQAALASALRAGIGPGRERGYGAMSVHPGKATSLESPRIRPPVRGGRAGAKEACELVLKWRRTGEPLPSPSQIRAVQQRLADGGANAALAYLDERSQRAPRIWFAWEAIDQDLRRLVREYEADVTDKALELLADLAILDAKEDRR